MDKSEMRELAREIRTMFATVKEKLAELEELEKREPKTGKVKSVDEVGDGKTKYRPAYIVGEDGEVWHTLNEITKMQLEMNIESGNVFHDKESAEKEALKRKVLHKLWCEFGDDVSIIPSRLTNDYYKHNRIAFACEVRIVDMLKPRVKQFIDNLTEEEREVLR